MTQGLSDCTLSVQAIELPGPRRAYRAHPVSARHAHLRITITTGMDHDSLLHLQQISSKNVTPGGGFERKPVSLRDRLGRTGSRSETDMSGCMQR